MEVVCFEKLIQESELCVSEDHVWQTLDVALVEAGYVAQYLGLIAEAAGRLHRELRWDPAAESDSWATRPLIVC